LVTEKGSWVGTIPHTSSQGEYKSQNCRCTGGKGLEGKQKETWKIGITAEKPFWGGPPKQLEGKDQILLQNSKDYLTYGLSLEKGGGEKGIDSVPAFCERLQKQPRKKKEKGVRLRRTGTKSAPKKILSSKVFKKPEKEGEAKEVERVLNIFGGQSQRTSADQA